jgi:hypothetical protein
MSSTSYSPLLNFYVLEAIPAFFRRIYRIASTAHCQLSTFNFPLFSGLTGAADTVYGQARGLFRKAVKESPWYFNHCFFICQKQYFHCPC